MTDLSHDIDDEPAPLVERLRNTAINLTTTYVATDRNGDPLERPGDGTEEADFDDFHDPVEFEPEELHDLATLYREAADALDAAAETEAALAKAHGNTGTLAAISSAEETRKSLLTILGPETPAEHATAALSLLARLAAHRAFSLEESNKTLRETVALQEKALAMLQGGGDPPNRAPLLAQLEALLTSEPTNLGPIRNAIDAIRTDARVIEASRGALKGWHAWARKLARAEGDEYASARPERLQAHISAQHEAGSLALLVAPIHRRVQLVQDLCADMGLGMQEAAELAPKAALWTDAEVAEIEAFRTRDWSGTKLNPFDHLPPALERTVYPEPGGRRAYFKRIGDPLPPEAPKPEDTQQTLPGLPKPETALRLRLALIDKPDSPEVALVAGFAQAMLERLDKLDVVRWTLSQILSTGTRLPDIFNLFTGTFVANAIPDRWPVECERLTETMIAVSAAEYGRLWCVASALGGVEGMEAAAKERDEFGNWLVTTFQPGHVDEEAVLMPRGEYESGAAFCRRVLQLALDRGAFSVGSGRIEGLRFEELPEADGWRAWARTVIDCVDGTDAELQALIGRMLATANKLRRQNQLAFDALASGPLPMVAPSYPLDAQMATTADVVERARAAAANLRYAMGHPQQSPDPTPAAMQDAEQVLTVAAAVLEAKPAADPWTPTWEADCGVWPIFYADAPGGGVDRLRLSVDASDFMLHRGDSYGTSVVGMQSEPNWAKGSVVEYRSLAEVAAAYPMVSPTLDDYKAGRLVPFAEVRAEAFRLAGLADPGDAPRG